MARRHPVGIPPVRCVAHKKDGEQCRRYATVGTTVCYMHGGANGTTIRKAQERVTVAQLMERNPRAHPWEVVLDSTHTMDVIVRDLRDRVLVGEHVTVDQLDRLINFNQVRHHMATAAITTKAAEKVSLAFEQHLEMQGRMVATAIAAGLDKLGLSEPWRVFALQVAQRALLGDEAQGDEPQPPEDPIVREYDVGSHGTAPAIEAVTAAAVSPCDVATLDDDQLRDLGTRVLDELERRNVDG